MAEIFDLVIKNGKIIDGTGNPWFSGDVGIKDDKIKRIGFINSSRAKKTIDASEMIVSPGFIDIHNHSDLTVLAYPECDSNIRQGITTAVVGNCGISMAPIDQQKLSLLQDYLSPLLAPDYSYRWNWSSLNEYINIIEKKGTALNLAFLVGQGNIRLAVKGFTNNSASETEMAKMKKALKEGIESNAYGMSTGLIYPPGCYSSTEELIQLGKVLNEYGRIYASHIRDEGDNLIQSTKEAIKIGEICNIPVEISHFKAKGEENWGKVQHGLYLMEEARARGVEVNCDVYPYEATSTTITSLLPSWTMENGIEEMIKILKNKQQREKIKEQFLQGLVKGNNLEISGFDRIVIANSPLNKNYEGKSLEEIAKVMGQEDYFYALFDLVIEIKGNGSVVKFVVSEKDIEYAIAHPLSMIGSDSSGLSIKMGGRPHPRAYGTFTKIIRKFVYEKKLFTIQEAIRKMTSMPASKIKLMKRGLLGEGFYADIVIFKLEEIKDNATFLNPHQYSSGIYYTIVNGKIAFDATKPAIQRYGKILKPE
jgi:N-acyl-D-amino-acid deacylase